MSHQTGIAASQQLKEFLATALTFSIRKLRLIKVAIVNEELVLVEYREAVGSWTEDYDTAVLSVVKETEPCYLFYRLDSQNECGFEWLFIPFAPDVAEVREKMLHAATRGTVKMEFGTGRIKDELFGTVLSDIDLAGYRKHVACRNAAGPLTASEEELQAVRNMHTEVAAAAGAQGKTKSLPGIAFPIDENAVTELQRITRKEITHVQLAIDGVNEVIYLVRSGNTTVDELNATIPRDFPTYNFFLFTRDTSEAKGEDLQCMVFVSSMPSEKCTIREKMLYSSCKSPLLAGVREQLGMEIARKIEVGEDDVVDADFLSGYLNPPERREPVKFEKPKGPGGRGGRRLIKTGGGDGGGDV